MIDLEGLAKGLGEQLLQSVKGSLKEAWGEIPDDYKDEVKDVLIDAAKLTMRSLGGDNVDRELAHTKAAVASWGFVGASRVRTAIKDALAEAAVFAGKVLLKLVV